MGIRKWVGLSLSGAEAVEQLRQDISFRTHSKMEAFFEALNENVKGYVNDFSQT